MSIELEQAIDLIKKHMSPSTDVEMVDIENLHGRICAKDIKSSIATPPFNRSPLDGYALRAADTVGANEDTPVVITVIEDIVAGQWWSKTVTEGTAVRLTTGAPIPDGADCVIRQEDTNEGTDNVEVYAELSPYQNFCRAGEDIPAGEILVKEGECLSYVHAGVLAGAGLSNVMVYRKPKVVIIGTGDELWLPEAGKLPAGKIYSSNHAILGARLKNFGADVVEVRFAGDNINVIVSKIIEVSKKADLIITTGGVSVGCKDVVPDVMCKLEAEVIFHGVNLKPGTPAMFSIYKGLPVLSLSGNPFAAVTTLELLARPALAVLAQNKRLNIDHIKVALENEFPKASPGRRFIVGIYDDSGHVLIPDGSHTSGALGNMRGCNCLIDIPAGTGKLQAGDIVRVVRLF